MQYIRRIIIQIGKEILGFRKMQEKLEKRSFISFPYFFCNKNNKIKDESIGSKGRHTLDMDLQKKR